MESPHSLDTWDPRKEAYESKDFNSYTTGPGRNIPRDVLNSGKVPVQLYVQGIPNELTEEGLQNLFSSAGEVTHVKKMVSKKPERGDTFGFVTMASLPMADEAIRKLNQHNLGRFRLRVSIAQSPEEKLKRQKEREEKEQFLQSLNRDSASNRPVEDDRCSVVSNSSDRSKPSAGSAPGLRNMASASASPIKGLGRSKELFRVAGIPVNEPTVGEKKLTVTVGQHQSDRSVEFIGSAHQTENTASAGGDNVRAANVMQSKIQQAMDAKKSHLSEIQQRRMELPSGGAGDARPNHVQKKTDSARTVPPSSRIEPRPCLLCGRIGQCQCQACKGPYCSVKCQKLDWKDHQFLCKQRKAAPVPVADQFQNFEVSVPIIIDESQPKTTGRIKVASMEKSKFSPRQTEEVMITQYKSPTDFWIQLTSAKDEMDRLSLWLQQTYAGTSNTGNTAYVPERGELVAAQFSEDQCWYRAGVKAVNLDGSLLVTYLDYGNSEEVPVARVRRLQTNMPQLPLQGIHCTLHGLRWLKKPAEQYMATMARARCEERERNKLCGVTLLTADGADINEKLLEAGVMAPMLDSQELGPVPTNSVTVKAPAMPASVVAPSVPASVSAPTIPTTVTASLEPGHQVEMRLVDVVSPCQFWAVLVKNASELVNLGKQLDAHYKQMPPNTVYRPTVSQFVAAEYEGTFFRGVVKSLTDNMAAVFFCDYGNTDLIPVAVIHPLHQQFTSLPAQAVNWGLDGIQTASRNGEWSTEAQGLFIRLVQPNDIVGTIVTKIDDQIWIKETKRGQSDTVSEALVKAGQAVRVESKSVSAPRVVTSALQPTAAGSTTTGLPTTNETPAHRHKTLSSLPAQPEMKDKCTVVVSHVQTPLEFYVYNGATAQDLMTLNEAMMTHYSQKHERVSPVVGQLVAGLYNFDKSWCRVCVSEIRNTNALVYFIDYGNSEVIEVKDLAPLDEKFTQSPCLAYQCRLPGVKAADPAGQWGQDVIETFSADVTYKPFETDVKGFPGNGGQMTYELELKSENGRSWSELLLTTGVALAAPANTPAVEQSVSAPVVEQRSARAQAVEPRSARIVEVAPCVVTPATRKSRFMLDELPALEFEFIDPDLRAFIVHVDDPGHFYVQICKQEVADLLHVLNDALPQPGNAVEPYSSPQVGELVIALSSQHQLWYRACVRGVDGATGRVQVHYIDYGDSEWVAAQSVGGFNERLVTTPAAALSCWLAGLPRDHWTADVTDLFRVCMKQALPMKVVEKTGREYSIELVTGENVTVNQELAQLLQLSTPVNATTAPEAANRFMAVDAVLLRPPDQCVAKCMHANDPSDFYMVFSPQEALGTVDTIYANNTAVYSPIVGELVAARYSSDKAWYRAQVLQMDLSSSTAAVRFVDYGNEEEVAFSEIRKLDASLEAVPVQVVCCRIGGIEGTGESAQYTPNAVAKFKTYVSEDTMTMKVQGQIGTKYLVDLVSKNGMSLKEALLVSKLALPASDRYDSGIEESIASVSTGSSPQEQTVAPPVQESSPSLQSLPAPRLPHASFSVAFPEAISPEEFYIKILSPDADMFDSKMLEVQAFYSSSAADASFSARLQEGDICCAKFSADGQWYRVVVRERPAPDQLLVLFLDFGNAEVVAAGDVRVLRDDLLKFPIQAHHCSLAGIKPARGSWDRESLTMFGEFISGPPLQASIAAPSAKPLQVQLKKGSVDVATAMIKAGHALPSGDNNTQQQTRPAENSSSHLRPAVPSASSASASVSPRSHPSPSQMPTLSPVSPAQQNRSPAQMPTLSPVNQPQSRPPPAALSPVLPPALSSPGSRLGSSAAAAAVPQDSPAGMDTRLAQQERLIAEQRHLAEQQQRQIEMQQQQIEKLLAALTMNKK